jgi:hypothetical protein
MRKLINLLLAPLLGLSLSFAAVGPVFAQTPAPNSNTSGICEGVGLVGGTSDCDSGDPTSSVSNIIKTAINLISIVVGVIAVIMIIIGGLKYIMSSGDSNSINSAKNTILYAIVGLVIVAFAQIIVRYVLTKTPK